MAFGMSSGRPLSQRILALYDSMPRGERRLADLLLENGSAMRHDTATSLAATAGVSKATAARFFKRLGYPSFKVAQREAREKSVPLVPPRPGQRNDPSHAGEGGLGHHLETEIRNLVATIEQQRSDEIGEAIRLLARGDKLWVVGFGDNYPLAHFARALLIKLRSDIRMIPIGGFSVPEEFASIASSDVMLAFGVGRRSRSLRNVLGSASRAGAKVVLVTDHVGSGDAAHCTVILRARTVGASMFDSMTSTVSLLSYICASLATRIGDRAIDRLRFIENIHAEWGDLLDPER
jgi:DNA-binding MurR/RpiR family transcriptional regulator